MVKKNKLILFIFSAVIVGIISGLFGGGGGIICVPILKNILDLSDKESHATTVLVTAIISIPTTIVYITNLHSIDLVSVIFVSIGVLIGGLIGSVLLKKINNQILNVIFIVILFFAGLRMIF